MVVYSLLAIQTKLSFFTGVLNNLIQEKNARNAGNTTNGTMFRFLKVFFNFY